MGTHLPRVLFTYWGRRGLSRFAFEVARAALNSECVSATISVSRQNESFAAFSEFGDALLPVDTFSTDAGALWHAWRISLIRTTLLQHIVQQRIDLVIELMPHVWSPLIAPSVKAAGVRYATIIHDATPHPGDYRSASIEWLSKRTLRQADPILTLSSSVAARLRAMDQVPHNNIFPLFHPDLDYGGRRSATPPPLGKPWRLLFFGRIMPYKGLPLFLDLVDELRAQGIDVELGVLGEGDLGKSARRLSAMGAEIVNRWLTEAEIGALLPTFHAVVLSHIEASQSGVAAAAFGAGLPVIATPVGGIIEQVEDQVTGVIAARADATALTEAAKRLLLDVSLYQRICGNLVTLREARSVRNFVEQCVSHGLYTHTSADEHPRRALDAQRASSMIR